jgi:hypothetical protein
MEFGFGEVRDQHHTTVFVMRRNKQPGRRRSFKTFIDSVHASFGALYSRYIENDDDRWENMLSFRQVTFRNERFPSPHGFFLGVSEVDLEND